MDVGDLIVRESIADTIQIFFEMEADVERVSRSVYTFLDALASTGGLAFILILLAHGICALFNFHRLENELASRLYWDSNRGGQNNPVKLDAKG